MVSISLIIVAEAVMILRPGAKQNDVNNAYDTTLSVMRNYRNLSDQPEQTLHPLLHASGNHYCAVLGGGCADVASSSNRGHL